MISQPDTSAIDKFLKHFSTVIDAFQEPLFITDATWHILKANHAFYRNFMLTPEKIKGKSFYEIGKCSENLSGILNQFENVILHNCIIEGLEIIFTFGRLGMRTLRMSARRLDWEELEQPLLVITVKDVTVHKQEALATQQAHYKLHTMVYEYGMRYKSISLFNQMSEKLQSCTSIKETYPIVNYFSQKLFPSSAGILYMHNPDRHLFEPVTSWGRSPIQNVSLKADDCFAVQQKKIYLSQHGKTTPPCPHMQNHAGIESLCIPLPAHGEILGIMQLQKQTSDSMPDKSAEGSSTDGIYEEMQLAIALFGHLSLTLANIRLKNSLQQQAVSDPLTDLFNRRYMQETLIREVHRSNRLRAPLGIIMIDLDHFRDFNNTYGHDAGDTVLKEMAKVLKSGIRKDDIACRYGGEEFTLILPGATLDATYQRAENLRRAAAELKINHQDQVFQITLSAGIAVYPDHGVTWEAVLQASDTALYKAKNEGRNRVAVYGSQAFHTPMNTHLKNAVPPWAGSEEQPLGRQQLISKHPAKPATNQP